MNTTDIPLVNFLLGFLLILIPSYFLYRFKTGLVRSTLIAVARMTIQLLFIGFYLEYLFKWNKPWINILWVLIMIVIASYTAIKRTKLSIRQLIVPLSFSFFVALLLLDGYFMGFIVALDNLFDARYFVPISGMILGNMMSANVIALNVFMSDIRREKSMLMYMLANGATHREAISPFIRDGLVKSFSPTIASMAVMGLISLPGTMTGQILGGSSPNLAIRYQTMIMITIFSSSLISVITSLYFVEKKLFRSNGLLKSE